MIDKIFILESLSSGDIKSGQLLSHALQGSIDCSFKTIENAVELFAELESIKQQLAGKPGRYVIHFDCHGNEDGIGLFDRFDHIVFIKWEEFREIFRKFYEDTKIKPLISFSSCEGLHVIKLMAAFQPCPYDAIAGSLIEIPFVESVDGFALFYSELMKGTSLLEVSLLVRKQFPVLNFVATPAHILYEHAWQTYKNVQLDPKKIEERKQRIKSELIAITNINPLPVATQQMIDKYNPADTFAADEKKFKDIFYS